MGILHLTQLVNENSSTLREDVNIKNAKFKNVVIDGHSFFKTLLNKSSSFHYGGNYSDMYKMFSEPLKGIKECNVQMFVIFDGGCNIDKKLHTWVKRRNDEIEHINQFFKDLKLANDLNVATKGFLTNKGLPPNLPFAKSVFVQVLEDLDIRYVVSESEADVIIAAIANIEKSYVVTQDSDFFIFDIPRARGVISAKDFSELTKRKSKCGVYHRIKLMKLLHREDNFSEDNLSYLPVIFGCDYSNQNLLEDITKRLPLYTGKNSQTQYLEKLRNIFSLQKKELLQKVTEGKQELLDEVNKITGKYDLTSTRINKTAEKYLEILKSPKETCFDFTELYRRNDSKKSRKRFNKYLRLMVNHGVVSSTVLNVYIHRIKFNGIQFAETSRVHSSSMTSNLRKHIYSLLFKNTKRKVFIREYNRENGDLKEFSVCANNDIAPTFSEEKGTLEYLYNVTNCKIPVKITENRFFIIVTDVWINDCSVETADFLDAFILCYAFLQKNATMELNVEETEFSADLAYCGSCWQDIALELSCLIDMLGRPVDLPRIHKTYDGKLLHYINKEIALCEKEGQLLDTRFDDQVMQLYKSLKEILHQLNVDR